MLLIVAGQAQSFVWKVKDKPIYIGGTIHLLKPTDYPLPPAYEAAYKASSQLYFETDLQVMKKKESMDALMKAGMLPRGETLSALLPQAKVDILKKTAAEFKIPWNTLDALRPWMVMNLLSVSQLKKNGYETEKGIDFYFQDRAKQDRKPTYGLETLAEQIKAFQALDRVSLDVTEQMIRELQKTPEFLQQITGSWKKGDLVGFQKLMNDEIQKLSSDLYLYVMIDRNYRWLPKVQKIIDEGKPTFILVGAGHLLGSESLIELLQKKSIPLEIFTGEMASP